MDLEQAVIEAIKLKLTDTFKKVSISTSLEGRDIVIRISIPEEIMLQPALSIRNMQAIDAVNLQRLNNNDISPVSDLDIEAQLAHTELTGEQ